MDPMMKQKKVKTRLRSLLGNCSRLPGSYVRDKRGIAALEFALIAPIMIAFYFGLSEISMAIGADRNVAHAASVSGDLATQAAELDGDGVEDVMTATLAVLNIDSTDIADVSVELNSYQMCADNSVVRTGYARLGPQISAGGPANYNPGVLGTNMLNPTSGAVVARINHRYKPVTLTFMKNVTLSETFVLKPRKSVFVPFDDSGNDTFNCTAGSDLSVSCTASGSGGATCP